MFVIYTTIVVPETRNSLHFAVWVTRLENYSSNMRVLIKSDYVFSSAENIA